jgi:hypothetical protein
VWLEKIGYEPLRRDGEVLQPIPYTAAQHPVLLMHLRRPSQWARECYERHRELLESRTWIRGPDSARSDAEAA